MGLQLWRRPSHDGKKQVQTTLFGGKIVPPKEAKRSSSRKMGSASVGGENEGGSCSSVLTQHFKVVRNNKSAIKGTTTSSTLEGIGNVGESSVSYHGGERKSHLLEVVGKVLNMKPQINPEQVFETQAVDILPSGAWKTPVQINFNNSIPVEQKLESGNMVQAFYLPRETPIKAKQGVNIRKLNLKNGSDGNILQMFIKATKSHAGFVSMKDQ